MIFGFGSGFGLGVMVANVAAHHRGAADGGEALLDKVTSVVSSQ